MGKKPGASWGAIKTNQPHLGEDIKQRGCPGIGKKFEDAWEEKPFLPALKIKTFNAIFSIISPNPGHAGGGRGGGGSWGNTLVTK
jgi:hypothetical protein